MLNTLLSLVAVVVDHTSVVAVEQVVSSVITLRCLLPGGNHYLLADSLLLEIMQLLLAVVAVVQILRVRIHHKLVLKERPPL
tara:strand:+ start:102 stop:347 length:246 start_codon:yes stop_codon:yes gene_type:complete